MNKIMQDYQIIVDFRRYVHQCVKSKTQSFDDEKCARQFMKDHSLSGECLFSNFRDYSRLLLNLEDDAYFLMKGLTDFRKGIIF